MARVHQPGDFRSHWCMQPLRHVLQAAAHGLSAMKLGAYSRQLWFASAQAVLMLQNMWHAATYSLR
jgi:hypothetical protein